MPTLETPPPATTDSPAAYPGALLPLAEAAWASGLPRSVVQAAVDSGRVPLHRLVVGGRVVASVSLKEMEAFVRAHESDGAEDAGPPDPALRERIANLEGRLESSERVERSLQKYADKLELRSEKRLAKLEDQLSDARKREMSLARALGQAEARLEQARTPRLAEPRRRKRKLLGLFGR